MGLKNELDEFSRLLKQFVKGSVKATLRWVECQSVNWDKMTMTAIDGAELIYQNVLLGVGSAAVKPVVGTDCLIAIIENAETATFMLFADETELIQYNNGENGGLTITPNLVEQLDKNNKVLNALLNVLTGTTIVEAGNGAASSLQIALNTALTGLELGDFSNIENTKITH